MNDNHNLGPQQHAERLHLSRNVEQNGRCFVLALVAIAIAAGNLKGAVLIASILGIACVVDQLPGRARSIGSFVCYGLAVVFAVALLVSA